MSILSKLKNLVEDLEKDPSEEDSEPMSEISDDSESEKESLEEIPDYLECTEAETLEILRTVQILNQFKVRLADLLVQFEGRKQAILEAMVAGEGQLSESLVSLRLEYGIPDEGYTLELPSGEDKFAAFVKSHSE